MKILISKPSTKKLNGSALKWIQKRQIVQLHFGGGTPTYQSPEALSKITKSIRQHFSIAKEAEISIEVDPRVTTNEHLSALRKVGFNRISMGVQDFNPKVQEAINRIQTFDQTKSLIDASRSLGFESVNMDLIYGLPYQTKASFEKTIDQVLSIGPDRLAVYSYAHVPWLKKHQEPLAAHLPPEKEKYEIFLLALSRFTQAGFEYIGMDHFAKPNDELAVARKDRSLWRNFMGYTTKAGTDLFGIGMSSIGHINGYFVQNQREIRPYQEMMSKGQPTTIRGFHLSKDDKIRSRVIQNLLCHASVIKKDIETQFDITFDSYFKESLEKLKTLEEDQLVELKSDEIVPTDVGRIFLRNLAMPFDAYLPKPGQKRVFSKTV